MKICSIEGCGKKHFGHGWCAAHHRRWLRSGDPLGGRTPRGEPLRHFTEVVLRHDDANCLIWPFTRGNGYGQLKVGGRMQYVHRLVCEAVLGAPPTLAHEAAHNCGRGHEGCCNWRHLEWKTHAGNMADKLAHGTHNRGERCYRAKLSNIEAGRIKTDADTPTRVLAKRYGITHGAVCDIRSGRRWAWLD